MRSRTFVLPVVVVAVLAACTRSPSIHADRPSSHRAAGPADLLVLGSASGVTALDAADGSIPFSGGAVPAFTDWSTVFTATHVGGTTVLRAVRTDTGRALSTATLRGYLDVRVASQSGTRVALMAPLSPGVSPWTPRPRATTNVVVADPSGSVKPKRFHLKGNFEPEAFSVDGAKLFMISYVPPMHPLAYRVVSLDLGEGEVYPVFGRQKQWVNTMTGTRLMQVPAPNGAFLFTLYSNQPPGYARGFDPAQAAAGRPVAFVHTLNLDFGQAVCVGLPRSLWGGNPANEALAASPVDSRLYVVDTARGVIAVMSSDRLRVTQTARVDFGSPMAGAQTEAAVSPDGNSLYVSTGSAVVSLDTASLVATAKWNMPEPVSGMGFSDDGSRLYLTLPGEVQLVNPSSGRPVRSIGAAGVEGLRYVGTIGG
jgi:hypothetical protein